MLWVYKVWHTDQLIQNQLSNHVISYVCKSHGPAMYLAIVIAMHNC